MVNWTNLRALGYYDSLFIPTYKLHCTAKTDAIKWPVLKAIQVIVLSKIVSEYDQEIPQSQTADNPMAPRGRAAQPSRDTRKTN